MADDPMGHVTVQIGRGWNYRVMRIDQPDGSDWFEVREVFYDTDGKPGYYAESGHGPGGETLDEIRAEHAMIAQAFERPILTVADFPDEDVSPLHPKGDTDLPGVPHSVTSNDDTSGVSNV